jgi:predicted nucleic acid-binding protein
MVVLDATTLMLLIEPTARPPVDPQTKKPLAKSRERLEFLIETLSEAKTRVVIPTPVLSELLVRAGDAKNDYLLAITRTYAFMVAPFNEKAAVELAFLLEATLKAPKRKLTPKETWAKIKFDRQIIAIAKVNNVSVIYSDDMGLTTVAKANGLTVIHTWELPLPPVKAQTELDLPPPEKSGES